MDIQIKVGHHVILISLNEVPASFDFFSQLPLTLKIEDYASKEKIFYPPKNLTTMNSPSGYKPVVGDVTYYSPWGNVAIFYKEFTYSSGLIPLGRVISGIEFLNDLKNIEIIIEKVNK